MCATRRGPQWGPGKGGTVAPASQAREGGLAEACKTAEGKVACGPKEAGKAVADEPIVTFTALAPPNEGSSAAGCGRKGLFPLVGPAMEEEDPGGADM